MSGIEWTTPPQQPEGIRWRLVIAIVVGTLVVFGAGVAVQWVMADVQMQRRNPEYGRVPRLVGRPTVNLLEQKVFQEGERGVELDRERARWLDSYGWVDRAHGVIHVPIEDVFHRMAAGAGGGGG